MGIDKGCGDERSGVLYSVDPYYYTTMDVRVYEITMMVAGVIYIQKSQSTPVRMFLKSPSQRKWITLDIGGRTKVA